MSANIKLIIFIHNENDPSINHINDGCISEFPYSSLIFKYPKINPSADLNPIPRVLLYSAFICKIHPNSRSTLRIPSRYKQKFIVVSTLTSFPVKKHSDMQII